MLAGVTSGVLVPFVGELRVFEEISLALFACHGIPLGEILPASLLASFPLNQSLE